MISSDNIEKIINDTILDDKTVDEVVENKEDKKILEPVAEPKVNKKNAPYRIGTVTVNIVDVLEKPEKYSDIVTILKKGDTAIIEDDSDANYYKVMANIKIGYILKNQIKVK